MRISTAAGFVAVLVAIVSAAPLPPQSAATVDPAAAMHWRQIGPTRAGRARAVAGVREPAERVLHRLRQRRRVALDRLRLQLGAALRSASRPDRSARSRSRRRIPNMIYVGTGAGIIRPDLAIGDGVYKSTDAGKTWTHLGLRDSQMIAMIDVDPEGSEPAVRRRARPSVRAERRARHLPLDRRRQDVRESAVQGRVHERQRRAHRSERSEHRLRGALAAAAELHRRAARSAATGRRHLQVDRRRHDWKQLTDGLPTVIQANLAIAPSNSEDDLRDRRGRAATAPADGGRGGCRGAGDRPLGFYKSTDGGEHWFLADRRGADGSGTRAPPDTASARAHRRRRSADHHRRSEERERRLQLLHRVLAHRRRRRHLVGRARRAGRRRLSEDLDQPEQLRTSSSWSSRSGRASCRQSRRSVEQLVHQPTAAMYHVTTDNAFPYRVCGGQQDSGSACVDSRSKDGEITFHDWHPVNIQEYGVAAPDPKNPDLVLRQRAHQRLALQPQDRPDEGRRPEPGAAMRRGRTFARNVRTMPIVWSPVDPNVLFYASNAVWKTTDGGNSWTRISRDLTRQTWDVPANAGKYASSVTPAPHGQRSPRSRRRRATSTCSGPAPTTATSR